MSDQASAAVRPFDLLPYLRELGQIAEVRITGLEENVYLPHDTAELGVLEAARKFTGLYPDQDETVTPPQRTALRSLRLLFADWFVGTTDRYRRFLGLWRRLEQPQLSPLGYLLGDELLLLRAIGDTRYPCELIWRGRSLILTSNEEKLLRELLDSETGRLIKELLKNKLVKSQAAARTALSALNDKLAPHGLRVTPQDQYYQLRLCGVDAKKKRQSRAGPHQRRAPGTLRPKPASQRSRKSS